MTNPYRAMCAELVAAVDLLCGSGDSPGQPGSRLILTVHVEALDELANRASTLLAQPVAEGPTDEELLRLAREWNSGFESIELHFAADYARAVLAKWGNQ